MAVVRGFVFTGERPHQQRTVRVVEPELDMNRLRPQKSGTVYKLRELIRWLVPGGEMVRPPMRSVDRELEEVWPSGRASS